MSDEKVKNSARMQGIAEKLTQKYGVDLYKDEAPHIRLNLLGYDRLVIERYWDKPVFISVAHYFESNGDLVSDPQIEFLVKDGLWIPAAVEQYPGGYRRYIEIDYATERIQVLDSSNQRDLAAFANTWAKNIEAQGWLENATRYKGV